MIDQPHNKKLKKYYICRFVFDPSFSNKKIMNISYKNFLKKLKNYIYLTPSRKLIKSEVKITGSKSESIDCYYYRLIFQHKNQ